MRHRESGLAVIVDPMRVVESGNEADALLHLYYPKKDANWYLRFDMRREISRGNTRFGYWLLIHAAYAEPSALTP